MKRCPTCNQTFTESHLSFCIDDGTPLVPVDVDVAANDSAADEATVVRSASPSDNADSSSGSYESQAAGSRSPVPSYQPPGSYFPPGAPPGYTPQQAKQRVWPWLLGLGVIAIVLFGGLGIAAVMFLSRGPTLSSNTGPRNYNAPPRNDPNSNPGNSNYNSNSSNWNENLNSNSAAADTTPAPTDEAQVLSSLTDLEQAWTIANNKADKKALNRILADDYVATLPNGKLQGKAEYLRAATPDESIQKWSFEDLKLSLRGDRASLTGVLQLEATDEQGQTHSVAFRFTDKFVWRDGRWQATASEVEPVKAPPGVSA